MLSLIAWILLISIRGKLSAKLLSKLCLKALLKVGVEGFYNIVHAELVSSPYSNMAVIDIATIYFRVERIRLFKYTNSSSDLLMLIVPVVLITIKQTKYPVQQRTQTEKKATQTK